MRKMLIELAYRFLSLFGKAFSDRRIPPGKLLACVFQQKILGVNRKVPWPVHFTSQIRSPEKINRGNRNPGLSMGVYMDGRNGIILGKNVLLGPRSSIISMNHDMLRYDQYIKEEPVRLGDNCWLGTGAVILPGVQLGNHVIVAAGAVVTKSFLEDDILIGGVPARVIKKLEPYQVGGVEREGE